MPPFLGVVIELIEFVPEKDINGLAALTAARIVFYMVGHAIFLPETLWKPQTSR